ncbi:plexin, putative [Perkinsus marinus ATCC 50983]|uniref:Plexin, putative n=1 Tax=Perkinsus marinus (strain ATCC 50983 / TXsc) TaxID=423536 RepID=C5LN67_PERM5|nr:plexin, putative [Perkinsus marinus ATCC 50983]EER01866.1 plexin, putative [Perkinsus marinus ATCC 50983]|eukprot:XP_002769148.1 plexin, putative [Perkinsus marinus ATCC 50983]
MMVNASALGTAAYNVSWRYGDLSKRALADLLSQRDCDVQVPARVLDWNRLMCGPEFGVDYIDRTIAACGSDLLAAALSSETRYTIVLSSLKMAVAVAMNGVDYSPAITYDADQAWGLLYAVFLAPQIVGFLPAKGPEVGGYPIVLQVSGSTAWRVTSCRFQPVEGAPNQVGHWVDVPATTISDHEISCIAPLWHIEDGNRTAVVSISLEISETLWTNSTQFTYYKSPSIKHIDPAEGPHEGGTRVTVYGEGFDLYLVRDGLGSGMSCIFGRTVVTAHYLSPTEIFCFTPPSTTASPSVKGTVYDYMASKPQFILDPFLGPVSGDTRVTIRTADPLSIPRSIWQAAMSTAFCIFGTLRVTAAVDVDSSSLVCTSPPTTEPGEVRLMVSLNGHDIEDASQGFLYYSSPNITLVEPSMGPQGQATYITLSGGGFINTHFLTVMFGGISAIGESIPYKTRKAMWLSDSRIQVESPELSPSGELRVPLYISNNGQNFSPDGIDSWDADDDSHDDPKSLKYYTFHLPVAVYSVSPREGNIHGGGLVSVNGGPFVKTSNLLCSFDWVHVDPTVARPVVVSSTQVLCPVPDMWDARTADALNRRAKIRITLNGIDWSLSYATFTFYSMSPPGFTTHHTGELTFTSQIRSCPAGHMCEEFGLSHPLPCPPGSYQPRVGSRQCLECPKGYYCPRVRMERPVICPAGWVCDEEGLMTPYKRCPAGFICLEGTATGSEAPVVTTLVESNNPNINTAGLNAPKLCPRGLHCYPGTLALRSSPGNLSTPQPCSQGFFCPPGSAMPYGAGACPPGKYCPVPRSAGIVCKPRFRCGPMPGQFEPTECPAGTFNPYHGQHNCTLCREGGVCPFPLMDRPKPAECGYVAARKGIKSHSGNDLCPAGRICSWGVATTSEPKICTTISYDSAVNISSLEESCKSELGQAFVPRERARLVRIGGVVPNTWNDSLGLCCWDSDRVLQFLTGVALYYEGLRNPLINEARATWTLVGKVRQVNAEDRIRDSTAAGFDGLEMLANFTDDSLRLSWRVHLTRVRRKILLEIARQYFFKGPEPCPKGTFCNTGTCADLMTVISDSGQTYSSRRRRLEAEDIAGVDGVTRRKALPDSAIEYANMPKADLVRMEKDEQDEAIIQIRMLTSTERISSYPLGGVRLLQSDSGGELQTITLSGNHPLAIRAPQQCLAGTYCSIRANSSLGTSLCSAGQYCPSGASEPFPAPEGEFVGEVARVRGRMCTPGKFAPNPSSPICYPCPPGYSCPNFGTRTLFLCPPGTFRRSSGDDVASVFDDETPVVVGESGDALESSISCTPCDVGTWTVLRGTEDETGCDPCPAGRFCFTKTGNLSETNPCPEGYICGEGTTLETASKIPCLNGYYCGTGTSPISVYDSLCLKEFYCPEGTTYANRYNFRCPTGFYCPPGTGWKPDMDVPLRPNSAYIKYSDFLILQVAAQYCLRQIHAAEFKQIELINAESLNNELLDELPEAEVQTRLSQWTSSMSFCVQSQVEYIPMLAEGAEGVAKSLYEDEDWHSRQLQALQTPWKAPYEYSNKCLNDTFPRMRNGSTWDCLCHEEINDGHLMRCLTRAVDPYDEPYGAPFRYDIDDELSSTSCSPWPDCIDWSRVSQDNSAPGPEGGPYWDDFDRLAVSFIDYVRDALVKEMERTATDIDDNGESKQSITRCPFGTLTSEDAASELAMCTKRKSIVSLEDNADIIVSRVNPVAMANVESIPRPIPASQQGTIIPVIDDEDERIVYSLPARASAIITLDLRRLPSGVEYGRDWRVRVFVNDSLPHDFDDSQMCEEIWSRWYSDKEVYFDSLPDVREDNLRNHNCTMADMPIALERFMMASGSLCPSITDPFCIGFGFTQSISTTACRGVQDSAGQPKVIELSLHAMVDIQFRIEVQILNGMVMADRFSYIQTASVEVLEPSRNLLGTTNAFVVELRHDSGVALPFNTPLAALNRLTTDLDVKYDELSRQSTVSGVVASSQRGVLSKATLSWLPRDSNLTNCMRHPADYDEYLWAGSYFTNKRKTVWMSHLPFFSNCRGFGRVIPLWQVVEQGKNCRIVAEEDTDAVPVVLIRGANSDGKLMKVVSLSLKYWQKTSKEKVLIKAEVEYSEFDDPTAQQMSGEALWEYTLKIQWEGMSHIGVG